MSTLFFKKILNWSRQLRRGI